MKQDIVQEAVKAAPPVTVAGAHYFLGVSLNDWVLGVTLFYTVLLTLHLVWRWVREWRKK